MICFYELSFFSFSSETELKNIFGRVVFPALISLNGGDSGVVQGKYSPICFEKRVFSKRKKWAS